MQVNKKIYKYPIKKKKMKNLSLIKNNLNIRKNQKI